jgi:hypothetical protein
MRISTDNMSNRWTVPLFFSEADLILTDDEWRVILNVNLSTYQDVVSVIKSDLFMIEKQK